MLHKARTAVVAVLAAGALSLTACGGGTEEESGLGLVNEGSLTVCSNVPFEPFEYVVDGEYTGFDIDLTREIATGMGLDYQVQNVGFDGLQSGTVLAARQCDMIAAAMTVTEERADKLAFSDPYYDSLQSLLVKSGSSIASVADLDGKKVGVQQGTTGESYARDNAPEGAEIMSFQTDAELFQSLQAGGVDAVLQDLPVNQDHTGDGKFTVSATFETGEVYGFAMKKKGTEELTAEVNKQLSTLRENGKYQELYDKYFAQ
ncbi:basic amino acid ABC transporter substrate-binding protein [Arthrobacter sp. zg-Y40]|uniref:basic amino acid ABC transporter substrate-binding protein n=1 Tax=unclassified Arthrobacter TaxID=235627 RepID=UPI001D14426F|nr:MULTISPECIES: basic amino acid ABC transporter substrate-binding protein [unclassified Arthrobacter]MCC3275964.1 basic amino acid ABC transporter substrate-binding protein [Arthrobacter sp. zg-Y20]MCC3278056.1 basic amino acid ABC transporter substrate-binding protein [Arthrobacter sp. zg-Y40]MDK1316121.1 basic amino acid ABC transporter substrate-binding protein [Arthrobacter sp. zg.Y20]WIB05590.1 basic amino acid ABC transporter substrate-binding protein [Arthrobacter sp. zg-Y20]